MSVSGKQARAVKSTLETQCQKPRTGSGATKDPTQRSNPCGSPGLVSPWYALVTNNARYDIPNPIQDWAYTVFAKAEVFKMPLPDLTDRIRVGLRQANQKAKMWQDQYMSTETGEFIVRIILHELATKAPLMVW